MGYLLICISGSLTHKYQTHIKASSTKTGRTFQIVQTKKIKGDGSWLSSVMAILYQIKMFRVTVQVIVVSAKHILHAKVSTEAECTAMQWKYTHWHLYELYE